MNKKLKILYTITDLGKGGAERFLLDLITDLDANYPFIEYRIAVADKIIKYDEFKENPNIHFVNYQPFTFKQLIGLEKTENKEYTQLLDEFQPDIIHSNRFLGEFMTLLDLRSEISYVCHGHDNMIQYRPFTFKTILNKQRLLWWLEYRFLRRKKYKNHPTYFIANSKDTESFYRTNLPSAQKKNVHLLPLGFNYNQHFKQKEYKVIDKIIINNVASYLPKKNQQFIVDIAEVLKAKNIDFVINLIGHGVEFENVQEKIKAKGLENHVLQHGLQANVEEWNQQADIYLHTAYYEPFGLVFLEAMAAGLPVICLDGKGNRDIIENDKNGYLFEEQDAEAFANKIIAYASDPEKYKEISLYAQEYSKKFDVSIRNKELVGFYKKH